MSSPLSGLICAGRRSHDEIQSILDSMKISTKDLAEITENAIHEQVDPMVILTLIEHDPGVAQYQFPDGSFLLHTACYKNAPSQVIQILLELNPDAAKETMPDSYEQLPLHYVCLVGETPYETIQLLLSHYPEAARETDVHDELPLHNVAGFNNVDAIQLLIDAYPDAIGAKNWKGQLPLHCCCEYNCSRQALQILIESYNGDESHHNGLAVRDMDGRTHLHNVAAFSEIRVELETFRFLVNCFPEAVRIADNNGMLPLHVACSRDGIGRSLEHVRVLLDIDLFSILKISHVGMSALEYSFGIAHDRRRQDRRPMPLEVRQFLREKQDEALRLMHESFEPAVVYFNLPDLVVATVWSFVLPKLWRPTDDEMNGGRYADV